MTRGRHREAHSRRALPPRSASSQTSTPGIRRTIDEVAEESLNSSHPCKPVSDFDQPSAEFRVSCRASDRKTTRRLAEREQFFDERLARHFSVPSMRLWAGARVAAAIHFLLFALFRQCLIAISDHGQALKARQCVRAIGHSAIQRRLRAQRSGGSLRDELMPGV